MPSDILTDLSDRVFSIRLNRPEKKNALSLAMYTAMVDAFNAAEADPNARAILLEGSDGCFTSGNDLKDFTRASPTATDSPALRFLAAISTARKPVVAAVTGPAIGIGTTMLLHCDLVYAAPDAQFHLPFVKLGLCPEAASSYLLPRLVGYQRAAELLLLGEPFDAEWAYEVGLVNAVVHEGDVGAYARTHARRLAHQPPSALQLTKVLLKRASAAAVTETIAHEGQHFTQQLSSPEAQEALAAFFEGRPPTFD